MALLEVRGLAKSFHKQNTTVRAVDDVSFAMRSGECLGLVGESGCGKTTIAHILARLVKEDSGTILFNGKPVNRTRYLSPPGKDLQMIFQDPAGSFDPRDTVMQAVTQGARAFRMGTKAELEQKAYEVFAFVGLKRTYAKEKVADLSGGECQRAAIARALLCEPRLLVCDEATSALDVLVQAQIVDLLKRLKTKNDMAILFITHDMPLAATLCERVAVMYRGAIVETGATAEVIHRPQHAYTQKLINAVI